MRADQLQSLQIGRFRCLMVGVSLRPMIVQTHATLVRVNSQSLFCYVTNLTDTSRRSYPIGRLQNVNILLPIE